MLLTEIRRYPVKSLRGDAVQEAVVEPWGLAGDRRWMLVDAAGDVVTAREVNRMLLLHPTETATGLHITAPGREPLDVAAPSGVEAVRVAVFGTELVAAPAGPEADAWFSAALEDDVRLVWLDDPTRRQVRQDYGEPDDLVSFADGFPLLLASEDSLAALDADLPEGQQPLSMVRFRPNVVVSGAPAWAEDDWRRIRIGEAEFRAVKACDRCVMTTVDPETGERGKEPTATLARTRRFDRRTWFAVNLVPVGAGATIRVGDEVEVLEAVAPGGGPLREPLRPR